MARDFNGKLTVPPASATSLLSLLIAAGFTAMPIAKEVTIKNGAALLYKGHDSTVSAANGFEIAAAAIDNDQGAVDLTQIYLFSTAGTSITVKIRG